MYMEAKKTSPVCKICKRKAIEINEYIQAGIAENSTADSIARSDGTYNYMTNEFYCTICYVNIGCPSGTA